MGNKQLLSSPLHLTLSVLWFLGLLKLPHPVHGSLTPCVPPGPAYVQLRGSGGNPGTQQTSLHTNLSWPHSPLPSLAPREITIKLKLINPCLTLFNCSLFSLLSSAYRPQHLSPPSLLMTLLCSSMRSLQTSGAPSPPPPTRPPLCASLSVLTPCLPAFSPLTDTDVFQRLLSHRPTTCALDPIPYRQ